MKIITLALAAVLLAAPAVHDDHLFYISVADVQKLFED